MKSPDNPRGGHSPMLGYSEEFGGKTSRESCFCDTVSRCITQSELPLDAAAVGRLEVENAGNGKTRTFENLNA